MIIIYFFHSNIKTYWPQTNWTVIKQKFNSKYITLYPVNRMCYAVNIVIDNNVIWGNTHVKIHISSDYTIFQKDCQSRNILFEEMNGVITTSTCRLVVRTPALYSSPLPVLQDYFLSPVLRKDLPRAGIKFGWQSPQKTVKRNRSMATDLWNLHPEFFSSSQRNKPTARVREERKEIQTETDLHWRSKGSSCGARLCQTVCASLL